ncbi:hypothetical protein NFI95_06460 [Acetobacteraceae bacterium KSS8]|uniref:Multiple resistance and pH regulation protein F n=1 Tax=Endosaccharibacter trunci TaxID=2812733 RepID=A0ABT1W8D2_9PROT|nr:hypothetical protein [Acetobacteraceae bacterium KSS8]
MTIWLLATLGVLVPAMVALVCVGRGSGFARLAALQLATSLSAMVLALMCFAFEQPSFMDLSLALILLSVPANFVFAMFWERWL